MASKVAIERNSVSSGQPYFIPHDEFGSTAAGGGKAPRSGVVAGGDRRDPPVSYHDIRRPRRGQRTQDKYRKKRYQTHVHHILAILFHNCHSIFRMNQKKPGITYHCSNCRQALVKASFKERPASGIGGVL